MDTDKTLANFGVEVRCKIYGQGLKRKLRLFLFSRMKALVARLNNGGSVQIALRLAEEDLPEARRIATRKGIGCQTLLKMLLHEGLQREAQRR